MPAANSISRRAHCQKLFNFSKNHLILKHVDLHKNHHENDFFYSRADLRFQDSLGINDIIGKWGLLDSFWARKMTSSILDISLMGYFMHEPDWEAYWFNNNSYRGKIKCQNQTYINYLSNQPCSNPFIGHKMYLGVPRCTWVYVFRVG